MNLKQLQKEQKKWADHNFPKRTSSLVLLGVMEEVGELAHAHLKKQQNIRDIQPSAKADAIADIIIYLSDYCTQENIDMQDAIDATWSIVKKRNWVKFPKNGISE